METRHNLFFSNSENMSQIASESVDLIITSPAYPMIEMWDSLYGSLNPKIKDSLDLKKGNKAFDLIHKELDKTWAESYRVLKKGGFACINIGDATRTIGDSFQLYSNHSRIIRAFKTLGFNVLPVILWHKKTNAPNKFMGSGMLPAGAYVTLEHEYILVFRKGPKRIFKTREDKHLRQRSAFFWEERNKWFSDIWFDLKGVSQNTNHKKLRHRSAAFPLDLAYRLICMYSVQSDTVLDPFAGTGTTVLSAVGAGRNSIGIEIDRAFREYIITQLIESVNDLNNKISKRLLDHIQYTKEYILKKGLMKHNNSYYNFPVMTAQETSIQIPYLKSVKLVDDDCVSVRHSFIPEIKDTKIDYDQGNQIELRM